MLSLLLRNLFFTILQPGLVAGLIPWLIVRKQITSGMLSPIQWHHILGLIVFIIGFVILLHCVLRFAFEGRGTISPVDPTKELVVSGLYQYSRNPMYLGVICMLLGETVFFRSLLLLGYSIVVFLVFHLFIILHEEPRLHRVFGKEYTVYCARVRRWI